MNPTHKKLVAVTGAGGFVARGLFDYRTAGHEFVAISRKKLEIPKTIWRQAPSLSKTADWRSILEGVHTVVHLASRAHLLRGGDPQIYLEENGLATLKIAEDAQRAGVRRFVFMSSAKVLGDETIEGPLSETAPYRPNGAYATSKVWAERALRELKGDMEIAILRPPLVYGPGVKANFLALMSAVIRGVPMPLAGIRNQRSLISVSNLASAISACIESPRAGDSIFHVTDECPISTPELVLTIAKAANKHARMVNLSPSILEAIGSLFGRMETVKKLTRSFELEDAAIRRELSWRPSQSFECGIQECVDWYRRAEI